MLCGAVAFAFLARVWKPPVTDNIPYDAPLPAFLASAFKTVIDSLQMLLDTLTPPLMKVLNTNWGMNRAATLYACSKVGVFEILARDGQPKSVVELSDATHVQPRKLYQLLRACASLGALRDVQVELTTRGVEDGMDAEMPWLQRRYQLAPLGDILREDHPYSAKASLHHQIEDVAPALLHLFEGIKDPSRVPLTLGHASLNLSHTPHALWEYFEKRPEQGVQFTQAMTSLEALGAGLLLQAYPWTDCATIVDVGGGRGSFLSRLLRAAPRAKGVLFDLPSVISEAKQSPFLAPLADRVSFVPGSFFQPELPSFAEGRVCYTSRIVLHDWDDESAMKIASNVASAMKSMVDRYILHEIILGSPERDPLRTMCDVQMLSIGGTERTIAEFSQLLKQAGLVLQSHRHTASPISVVEFYKPH